MIRLPPRRERKVSLPYRMPLDAPNGSRRAEGGSDKNETKTPVDKSNLVQITLERYLTLRILSESSHHWG